MKISGVINESVFRSKEITVDFVLDKSYLEYYVLIWTLHLMWDDERLVAMIMNYLKTKKY